jgi:hypothetical protein
MKKETGKFRARTKDMSPVMFSLKFDHIIYYGGRKITREDVLG